MTMLLQYKCIVRNTMNGRQYHDDDGKDESYSDTRNGFDQEKAAHKMQLSRCSLTTMTYYGIDLLILFRGCKPRQQEPRRP
jgi:hypothetical protein